MEENNLNIAPVQPEIPVVPENVAPPAPPAIPPKPQNNSMLIMFSILLIIFVGIMAILGYQNFQLQKQVASLQPTASPVPTATPDPTLNWKTYTNPANAYSFKYPDGLNSSDSSGGTGFESIHFTFIGPAQLASGKTQTELSDGYSFDVIKLGPILQFDPKTQANKTLENSKQNCNSVSTLSSVIVAGTNAFQYSVNCLGTSTFSYLSDGKNTYAVTQLYTSDAYKATTNQILSTFKFLGQTTNSNLKTYTDPKYGYSFDYPTGWTPIIKTVSKGQTVTDPGFYTMAATEDDVQALRLTKNGWIVEITSQKNFQPGSCGGISGIDNINDFRQISALGGAVWREDLENGKFWAGGDEPDPHPQPIFFKGDSTYQYRFCSDNNQTPLRLSIVYYSPTFTAANIQSKKLDYNMVSEMDGILKTLH